MKLIPVVPEKIYNDLMNHKISEKKDNFIFSIEDFEKNHSESYSDILYYIKHSNIDYVGNGSSRVAFLIPPGIFKQNKNQPSCMKVAKNRPGVAQNENEILIFSKFSRKFQCFPRMYLYDKKNKLYIFTELGKNLNNQNEFNEYFKEWNEKLNESEIGNILNSVGTKMFSKILNIALIAEQLETYNNADNNIIIKYDKFLESMKEIKKYIPLVDLFYFIKINGIKYFTLSDFRDSNNWAWVTRDGISCAIPIDFGFTDKIGKKYYSKNKAKRAKWKF